jgi:hypothetical protein
MCLERAADERRDAADKQRRETSVITGIIQDVGKEMDRLKRAGRLESTKPKSKKSN